MKRRARTWPTRWSITVGMWFFFHSGFDIENGKKLLEAISQLRRRFKMERDIRGTNTVGILERDWIPCEG